MFNLNDCLLPHQRWAGPAASRRRACGRPPASGTCACACPSAAGRAAAALRRAAAPPSRAPRQRWRARAPNGDRRRHCWPAPTQPARRCLSRTRRVTGAATTGAASLSRGRCLGRKELRSIGYAASVEHALSPLHPIRPAHPYAPPRQRAAARLSSKRQRRLRWRRLTWRRLQRRRPAAWGWRMRSRKRQRRLLPSGIL